MSPDTSTRFGRVRSQLIERAYIGLINGNDFNDVQFQAFSTRSRAGKRGKPRTLHALSSVLEAASPTMKGMSSGCVGFQCQSDQGLSEYLVERATPGIRPRPQLDDANYEDDSDLSDCEDDSEERDQAHSSASNAIVCDHTASWCPYPSVSAAPRVVDCSFNEEGA